MQIFLLERIQNCDTNKNNQQNSVCSHTKNQGPDQLVGPAYKAKIVQKLKSVSDLPTEPEFEETFAQKLKHGSD